MIMRSAKKGIAACIVLVISFSITLGADRETLNEFVKKAETYLLEGKEGAAQKYFIACRDLALKEDSWKNIIQAGYGLAYLKNDSEALRSYSMARDVAWKQGNWEGLFFAAQGLTTFGNFKDAYETALMVRDTAWTFFCDAWQTL